MPNVQLIILVGSYAQKYYLAEKTKRNLTDTVSEFNEYLPRYFPIPHPSPTNRFWRAKNPWFEKEIVPILQQKVEEVLH